MCIGSFTDVIILLLILFKVLYEIAYAYGNCILHLNFDAPYTRSPDKCKTSGGSKGIFSIVYL